MPAMSMALPCSSPVRGALNINFDYTLCVGGGLSSEIIPFTPRDDNHFHDRGLLIVHVFICMFFLFA